MVPSRRGLLLGGGFAAVAVAVGTAEAIHHPSAPEVPLRQAAEQTGLVYGSSTATWQLADADYAALYGRQSAMLLTEDDLLWYRIRPSVTSGLHFERPDRIVAFAERHGKPVVGAHLAWDQGFGPGWTAHQLATLGRDTARTLLFGTVDAAVSRYRNRIATWSCVNEAIASTTDDARDGLRTDVPWYRSIGADYVADTFHVAHRADPDARLILNDFGYETIDSYGNRPEDKRRTTLAVLDRLLGDGVPVHAFGLQAHLSAVDFAARFDAAGYAGFLRELAARGVEIMITELDVLDDGLPADTVSRDAGVADVYARYLDTALAEPAIGTVLTFGLSDRYTWLDQDYPRRDGAHRRPLPFDAQLRPVAAFGALEQALRSRPGS